MKINQKSWHYRYLTWVFPHEDHGKSSYVYVRNLLLAILVVPLVALPIVLLLAGTAWKHAREFRNVS